MAGRGEVVARRGEVVAGRGEVAKSDEDLTAGGLQRRTPRPSAALLLPPESVAITFPKKLRGQFTASAHHTGAGRALYAAQLSSDASTEASWVDLKGTGKARKVTGQRAAPRSGSGSRG